MVVVVVVVVVVIVVVESIMQFVLTEHLFAILSTCCFIFLYVSYQS